MQHRTATRADWLAERTALLAREKDFNTARDALTKARQNLPWVRVEKDYVFDSDTGPRTLAELFQSHRQLIVYHYMFGKDWEQGCKSCSYWIDNFEGIAPHLAARDTALVMVSKGPLDTLLAFGKRMGWSLPWLSSLNSDFNEDYGVTFSDKARESDVSYNYRQTSVGISDMPGISVFTRDDTGHIYHTYSTYSRGLDMLNGAYHLLDITPIGRNETDLPFSMSWLNFNDSY